MKNILAAVAAALALAACAGQPTASSGAPATGTATAQQTPAQIAAQICVPLQAAITGLQADIGLSASTLASLISAEIGRAHV